MTATFAAEVDANLHRAEQSVDAARQLAAKGYGDFAASRAYYAAFYAATALLLNDGIDLGRHSGVIAAIHQMFVKRGKLQKEHGKMLNWLFELRNVGDYGGVSHVSSHEVESAIEGAEMFIEAVKTLLANSSQ